MTTVTSPWPGLGQPLFEMCWVYMAIAQIAQDPPPSVKQTNVEKKCSKPSWQAFTPPPLTGNAHVETTHFKKRASLRSQAPLYQPLCIKITDLSKHFFSRVWSGINFHFLRPTSFLLRISAAYTQETHLK